MYLIVKFFSYLYPNKNVFFMTQRVFCSTCCVQDLSHRLDKTLLDLLSVFLLGILELKRDIGVIILLLKNICVC